MHCTDGRLALVGVKLVLCKRFLQQGDPFFDLVSLPECTILMLEPDELALRGLAC